MELVINIFKGLFGKIDYLQSLGTDVYLIAIFVVGIVFCYGGFIVFRITFWLVGAFVGAYYAMGLSTNEFIYVLYAVLGAMVGAILFAMIFAFGIAFIGACFGFMVGLAFDSNIAIFICVLVGAVVAVKMLYPFIILTSSYMGALAMSFAYLNAAQYFENGQLLWGDGIAYYGRYMLDNLIDFVTFNVKFSQISSEFWIFIMTFTTGILIQWYLYFKKSHGEDAGDLENWREGY
jgi:hypothetical protein